MCIPSPSHLEQSTADNWSQIGAEREYQLDLTLILRSLSERHNVGEDDEVHADDASTTDTLDHSASDHAGEVMRGAANDRADGEETYGCPVDGPTTPDVRQGGLDRLTDSIGEEVARGYPERFRGVGVECLSDGLRVYQQVSRLEDYGMVIPADLSSG